MATGKGKWVQTGPSSWKNKPTSADDKKSPTTYIPGGKEFRDQKAKERARELAKLGYPAGGNKSKSSLGYDVNGKPIKPGGVRDTKNPTPRSGPMINTASTGDGYRPRTRTAPTPMPTPRTRTAPAPAPSSGVGKLAAKKGGGGRTPEGYGVSRNPTKRKRGQGFLATWDAGNKVDRQLKGTKEEALKILAGNRSKLTKKSPTGKIGIKGDWGTKVKLGVDIGVAKKAIGKRPSAKKLP